MIKLHREAFDSKIFNKNVFRLWFKSTLNRTRLIQLIRKNNADVVFCFSAFSPKAIQTLSQCEFAYIGSRVTYRYIHSKPIVVKKTPYLHIKSSKDVGALSPGDEQKILKVLMATSRYFKDLNLKRNKVKLLYRTWLRNSLYNKYATEYFIATWEKKFAGLITLKIRGENAFIDLIGVNKEFQGLGIGRALLSTGLDFLRRKALKNIFVITEAENIQANSFYQSGNFRYLNYELVFHYHKGVDGAKK